MSSEVALQVGQNPRVAVFVAGCLLVFVAGIAADIFLLVRLRLRPPDWAERAGALRSRTWQLDDALFILLVLVGMRVVLLLLGGGSADAALSASAEPGQDFFWPVVFSTATLHGMALLLVLTLLAARRASWGAAFGFSSRGVARRIGQGALSYLAVMPPVMAAWVVTVVVAVSLGVKPEKQLIMQLLERFGSPRLYAFIGIMAVAGAPFVEEILFRGVGLPVLARYAPPARAVVWMSLCFAVIHFHLPSLLPIFVLGVGLSLAYLATGDLLVPVVMHAAFNAVSLAAAVLLKGTGLDT